MTEPGQGGVRCHLEYHLAPAHSGAATQREAGRRRPGVGGSRRVQRWPSPGKGSIDRGEHRCSPGQRKRRRPGDHSNVQLTETKASYRPQDKAKLKDVPGNACPGLLKIPKVTKNKGSLRHCHSPEEAAETGRLHVTRHPGWDSGTEKGQQCKNW